MKLITNLKLTGNNNTEKIISFEKDNKINEIQLIYFNSLFNSDLTLNSKFDEFAYWGAFRCSKSFSQQLATYLICQIYRNVRAIYIRNTYDQLEDSVITQFNDEFEYLGKYSYHKTDRICEFDNGSTLIFRTFERDTGILSTQYDLIALCQAEDIKKELALQLFGRLSGKALPKPLLLTEGNPSAGWAKERYKEKPREELKQRGILFLEGKTEDNPWITKDYIERLKQNYPDFWLRRYLYGEWGSFDEMVFSEFKEYKHVIEFISYEHIKPFKQRAGFDYGWRNPCAMIWSYIDYDGNITIFDEWGGSQQTSDMIAKEALRYGNIPIIADYSMKRPDRDGRSVWKDLIQKKLNLIEANKQELENITLVNMLFKQGRLKITRNCINLIKEIQNWKWKSIKLGNDKNVPEEPIDKDNHYCDALNYLISNIEGRKTQNPEEEKYKKTLEYHNIQLSKKVWQWS